MKKNLILLFFLGLTTTGFAQLLQTKEYSGRAAVNRTSTTIEINCRPAESLCFSTTRLSTSHGLVMLRVPDYFIEEVVSPMSTINGVPIVDIPNDNSEDNSVERHYIIELQPIEG